MKYKPEDYNLENCGFYGVDDTEILNYKEKLIKCRKRHVCRGGCNKDINIGEYAVRETGFIDGRSVTCYTCTDCIDGWLDEIAKDDKEVE